MSPDTSVIHQAMFEIYVLPRDYVLLCEKNFSVRTDNLARIGRDFVQGKVSSSQQHRHMLAGAYSECFSGCDLLELPACRPEVEHAWHIYLVRLRTEALTIDRDQVIEELREANIGTSVHFIPLHMHSYYAERCGVTSGQLPVADAVFPRLLSLPIHPGMSRADAEQVAGILTDVLKRNRR